MVMLWVSMLGSARAEFPDWTHYAQCAAATAVAMPVTYAMGEVLTGTSNELVPGMLPAVISGIVLPASVSVGSASLIADKAGLEMNIGTVFGQTVGLNAGVYATGTAVGVSLQMARQTDIWSCECTVASIAIDVVHEVPNSTASLLVAPNASDGWMMNAVSSIVFKVGEYDVVNIVRIGVYGRVQQS